MTAPELFLVRHLAPLDAEGLCYGRSEVRCAPPTVETAAPLLARLPPGPRLDVVTSPAERCTALAAFLARRLGAPPPRVDPRLVELSFGEWEGRRWADIPRAESDPWSADYMNTAPPGGETGAALTDRARSFLADVRGAPLPVVAVTHGGFVRAALAAAAGATDPFSMSGLPFGGVLRVDVRDLLRHPLV